MDRSVWTINNKHFTLILDAKTEHGKISDRKFSPGEDIWTSEIPQLKFEDDNIQKEYDNEPIIIRKIEDYEVEKVIS